MTKRRHYNPFILRVMQLLWEGYTAAEIAAITGRVPLTISNLIATDEAKEIYELLQGQTVNTARQVQTAIAAAAPSIVREKIDLALGAKSESVRNQAAQQLLEMAGHSPIRHLEIHRPDEIQADYDNKSDEDIRKEIMDGLISSGDDVPDSNPTVH